jgi:hypothetical protein
MSRKGLPTSSVPSAAAEGDLSGTQSIGSQNKRPSPFCRLTTILSHASRARNSTRVRVSECVRIAARSPARGEPCRSYTAIDLRFGFYEERQTFDRNLTKPRPLHGGAKGRKGSARRGGGQLRAVSIDNGSGFCDGTFSQTLARRLAPADHGWSSDVEPHGGADRRTILDECWRSRARGLNARTHARDLEAYLDHYRYDRPTLVATPTTGLPR